MFATFKSSKSESDIGLAPVRTPRPRGKRAQVRRACDACRLSRVKCDASKPCHNCRHAGRACITDGQESRGDGALVAISELDRLRQRVRELEAVQGPGLLTPQSSSPQSSSIQPSTTGSRPLSTEWRWKGLTHGGLRYGPLSDRFFVRRLSEYTQRDTWVQPLPPPASPATAASCDRLSRAQQDYFLEVYWTGYHVYFPIVDEDDFRKLYASLWPSDGGPRRAHPLVDTVLALMIQYAFPLMLEDGKVCVSSQDDAYRAGNPFLRRGQATLDSEVESPTLVAAQCRLLAAIYSANQGNYNTAHAMVEIAEQILSVIDVEDGSEVDRELFWRLRTCSRSQDVRFSLKLGRIRPNTHPKSKELLDYVTEKEATAGFSWLTFHRQLFLLSETVEDMARAFMSKCDEALFEDGQGDGSGGSDGGSRFYEDAEARESCAVFMRQQLSRLRTWLEQVPDAMKTARIAADESFSTAQSPLKLAEGDPMWLQRLRLDLECQYHDFCLTLLRPFVCFSPTPTRGTFASDNNCMSCASHAIALTGMLAQVMHETDILTGCPQAFEWLQNAVYALAGFATGYPISTRSPTARTALATADQVFVRLRSVAPGAPRMRDVAAELEAKAREIVQSFREGVVDLNGGGGAAAAASTTKETPPTTTAASSSIPSRSRGAQTASAKDNNDRPAPDPVTAPNPTPAPASAAPEQTLAGSGDAAHDLPFFADPDLVSGIGAVWDTDMELGLEWWPSQGTGGPDLWSTWMQDYDATAITG